MLKDILNFRRAVRYYAPTPISEEKVRECLQLATLAPTSSNMQLYELYHITNKDLLKKLAHACLDQRTATTAQQMVVFVTRQDKHRAHAKMILDFERGNVQRNSPLERQTKRIKDKEAYYGKLMPFVYSRFFWLVRRFPQIVWGGYQLVSPYDATTFRRRYSRECTQKLWTCSANFYAGNGRGRVRYLSVRGLRQQTY